MLLLILFIDLAEKYISQFKRNAGFFFIFETLIKKYINNILQFNLICSCSV